MEAQYFKYFNSNFISKNTFNIKKNWTFTENDISPFLDKISWGNYTSSYHLNVIEPQFPSLNVKAAVSKSNDNAKNFIPPYYEIDDDGYPLYSNYELGNGDTFCPLYEELKDRRNADGTYMKIVHYSLNKLLYSKFASYSNQEEYIKKMNPNNSSSLQENVFMLEIPRRYYGFTVSPGSFVWEDSSNISHHPYGGAQSIYIKDNEYGTLYDENYSSLIVGDIFYDKGLIIIKDEKYANYFINNYITGSKYNKYRQNISTSSLNCTINFDSSYIRNENKYICISKTNEFNQSSNPSLCDYIPVITESLSQYNSSSFYSSFGEDKFYYVIPKTSSLITDTYGSQIYFDRNKLSMPFVTTIGLYDNENSIEPVVIAKLAKPIQLNRNFDSVFIVQFDT